jgi:hypothetical protein
VLAAVHASEPERFVRGAPTNLDVTEMRPPRRQERQEALSFAYSTQKIPKSIDDDVGGRLIRKFSAVSRLGVLGVLAV